MTGCLMRSRGEVLGWALFGKGQALRVVGACGHVSFKVVVVRLDSCKGLSRGGEPAEGVSRWGGVWRIGNFWERFFCSAKGDLYSG